MNLSLISNFINAAVVLAVSLKVFSIYHRTASQELRQLFWDFGMGFFLVGSYFICLVLIDTLIGAVQFLQVLIHPFLYGAAGHFVVIGFAIYRKQVPRKLIIGSFFSLGIIMTLIHLATSQNLAFETYQGFLVIRISMPPFIRLVDGLVSATVFPVATMFIIQGVRTTDPTVRVRSILIGVGFFILIVASAISFVLGASNSALIIFVGSLLAIPSFLTILFGLLYRYRELPMAKAS